MQLNNMLPLQMLQDSVAKKPSTAASPSQSQTRPFQGKSYTAQPSAQPQTKDSTREKPQQIERPSDRSSPGNASELASTSQASHGTFMCTASLSSPGLPLANDDVLKNLFLTMLCNVWLCSHRLTMDYALSYATAEFSA